MSSRLVEYPWRGLDEFREIAKQHPDGLIDLSIGSPVDKVPQFVATALQHSVSAVGYPKTSGSPELIEAIVGWFERRRSVIGLAPSQVMPTVGSKEFISLLPMMLGLGHGDVVVQPRYAYTAYGVGAKLVGANLLSSDDPEEWPPNTRLVWLNSPSNPTGAVLSKLQLRNAVLRARELGAIVVNDECYAELPWTDPWLTDGVPSILDTDVLEGDRSGVLAIYSLSKSANLAGYRLGLAAGDESLIADLLNTRMHSGLMMPTPMQEVMTAALSQDDYLAETRASYSERREILLEAFLSASYEAQTCEAGLYLWLRSERLGWDAVAQLASLGILVAPGDFYSSSATKNLRVALTVPTELARQVKSRLTLI